MLKFGTDGVRGVANAELTPELALALGRAAARVLGGDRFAIGRDTRRSGPLLEAALCAGLVSEGVDVELLGVAPTPEVAWWSVTAEAPAAMVSASHNPFPDNGIKLFAAGGRKLRRRRRGAAGGTSCRRLLGDGASARGDAPTGGRVGRAVRAGGGVGALPGTAAAVVRLAGGPATWTACGRSSTAPTGRRRWSPPQC